jgi:hypothetical protein
MVALLWSRPADAQVGIDPGPPREHGGWCRALVIGAKYDMVNQAMAEWHLQRVQAKLARDAEQGDTAAADHDARRIDNLKYRIAMDEWLIRWNLLQNPGFYTIRTDPVACEAIAEAARPPETPEPPRQLPTPAMVAAPTIPITIVNAEPAAAGVAVAFAIDGVAHQAPAGSRQDLAVAPRSNITYDGGGSVGQRRYRISPGRYEFRSTAEGWALYKLASKP